MADIFDRLRKAAGDLDAHARHVFGDTQNYASLDNVGCYEHEKTCWDAYAEIERLQQARHAAECNLEAAHATVIRLSAALRSVVKHWREFGPEHGFDETLERAALAGGAEANKRSNERELEGMRGPEPDCPRCNAPLSECDCADVPDQRGVVPASASPRMVEYQCDRCRHPISKPAWTAFEPTCAYCGGTYRPSDQPGASQ